MAIKENSGLTKVILDACTVYEAGGDWRSIFRRAANTAKGQNRKVFNIMSTRANSVIDRVSLDIINTKLK